MACVVTEVLQSGVVGLRPSCILRCHGSFRIDEQVITLELICVL
jgi:hypothetical protein